MQARYALIASGLVKDELNAAGITGLKFREV